MSKRNNKGNVSLIYPSSKLFESVVGEAIMANATARNLLCENQFAYRKGRSCDVQLLLAQMDYAKTINSGESSDIVYFDFRSAFEVTIHSKLLHCLPEIGVGPHLSSTNAVFEY